MFPTRDAPLDAGVTRCSFGRDVWRSAQRTHVLRLVRDYIAAALYRQQPAVERFIAEHLQVPDSSRCIVIDPVAEIREILRLNMTPAFRGDFPAVDVAVVMRVALTGTLCEHGIDRGAQTVTVDVAVNALGTATGNGYSLQVRGARLTSWWGVA